MIFSEICTIEIHRTGLTLYLHPIPDFDKTALSCRDAVDFDQTLEANTHHAIWSSRYLPYDASPEFMSATDK
jgi:hypothetical protein